MTASNWRGFVSGKDGPGVLLQVGTIPGEDVERHFLREREDELQMQVTGAVSSAGTGKP